MWRNKVPDILERFAGKMANISKVAKETAYFFDSVRRIFLKVAKEKSGISHMVRHHIVDGDKSGELNDVRYVFDSPSDKSYFQKWRSEHRKSSFIIATFAPMHSFLAK